VAEAWDGAQQVPVPGPKLGHCENAIPWTMTAKLSAGHVRAIRVSELNAWGHMVEPEVPEKESAHEGESKKRLLRP